MTEIDIFKGFIGDTLKYDRNKCETITVCNTTSYYPLMQYKKIGVYEDYLTKNKNWIELDWISLFHNADYSIVGYRAMSNAKKEFKIEITNSSKYYVETNMKDRLNIFFKHEDRVLSMFSEMPTMGLMVVRKTKGGRYDIEWQIESEDFAKHRKLRKLLSNIQGDSRDENFIKLIQQFFDKELGFIARTANESL